MEYVHAQALGACDHQANQVVLTFSGPRGGRMALVGLDPANARQLAAELLTAARSADGASGDTALFADAEHVGPFKPARVASAKPRDAWRIAPGLFAFRDGDGSLRLCDHLFARGYVTAWSTPAKPDGHRADLWNAGHGVAVRKLYATREQAERALLRTGRKINAVSEAATDAEAFTVNEAAWNASRLFVRTLLDVQGDQLDEGARAKLEALA